MARTTPGARFTLLDRQTGEGAMPNDTIESIDVELTELHRHHPTAEMAAAAQLMVQQLDLALHGYTTARDATPREYWRQLLDEVQSRG